MWFDNALRKEKIAHMFDGGLDICNAEFTGFSFFDHFSVRFSFNIKRGFEEISQKMGRSWL